MRLYLIKENIETLNVPFWILTNLFNNKDNLIAILQSINPNFVNVNKKINDLEFYISQLCTFLLFVEKTTEEFFVFFYTKFVKLIFSLHI